MPRNQASFALIRLGNQQALPSALRTKTRAAHIGYPELHRTQARFAQGIAVLLDTVIDVRR